MKPKNYWKFTLPRIFSGKELYLLMENDKFRNLRRPLYQMPDFVKEALIEGDLMEAYRARPAYQQNDYIWWITQAKRQETKYKRLAQMLDELESGDKYMKMSYRPRKPSG